MFLRSYVKNFKHLNQFYSWKYIKSIIRSNIIWVLFYIFTLLRLRSSASTNLLIFLPFVKPIRHTPPSPPFIWHVRLYPCSRLEKFCSLIFDSCMQVSSICFFFKKVFFLVTMDLFLLSVKDGTWHDNF